jgi:hypothetical protein
MKRITLYQDNVLGVWLIALDGKYVKGWFYTKRQAENYIVDCLLARIDKEGK